MKVPFSNLREEFENVEEIDFRSVVEASDFTLGQKVEEFERAFADYVGVTHAIGVGSGTDAIKLSLKAGGVGPGDEVIVPAETFVATLGAVVEIGAVPVLVDVRDDFCIDPDLIEAAITTKTKAIVPVHLTGEMADMPKIMDIASSNKLIVVEDACQALGASMDRAHANVNVKAGAWGDLAAFSFHPMKNLCVWGDGGMITTDNDEYAKKLRLLRNHGLADRDRWECFGYNSRLDTIQAAVGLWMLPKLPEILANRQGNAQYYNVKLPTEIVGVPRVPRNSMAGHACHLYMILVEAKVRDTLASFLYERGIEVKIHYATPLWQQQAMADYELMRSRPCVVAERHSQTVISLPVHHHLTVDQLQYVCDTIKEFFKEKELVIPEEMRGKIPPEDELRPSPQDIHDVWERIYSKEDVELLDAVMADLCRDFPHLIKRLPTAGEKREMAVSNSRWSEAGVQELVDAAVKVAEMHPAIISGPKMEGIRTALDKLGIPFKRP